MHTDLIKDLLVKEGRELVDNWVKDIPMGRMAHPSELQGTAVWMASDASSYLNGSDVVCILKQSISAALLTDIDCRWGIYLLLDVNGTYHVVRDK
jgi:NAD(P)-dependent dehydrogenase (short-subunit alcohol dehydrogenase family)